MEMGPENLYGNRKTRNTNGLNPFGYLNYINLQLLVRWQMGRLTFMLAQVEQGLSLAIYVKDKCLTRKAKDMCINDRQRMPRGNS